jgi:hypothetical protein
MRTSLILAFSFLTIAQLQAQSIPNYVPSSGLLGWWPFSGNANDESGNNYNGVVNGATLTTDRFNNPNSAYNFNGINNRIMVYNFHNFFQSFSISCWIRTSYLPSSSPTKWKGILGKGTWGEGHGGDHTFFLALQDNHFVPQTSGLLIGFEDSQGNNTQMNYGGNYPGFLHTWKHVVATYDFAMNQFTLFVDGVPVAIQEASTVLNNSTAPLVIGNIFPHFNHSQVTQGYWNGKIDDIGIWNRTLTYQEVMDLYLACALTVDTQPVSVTAVVGDNAQFDITVSDPTADYQWQTDYGTGLVDIVNIGQYNGANSSSLVVSNLTMANNNQEFRCITSKGNCIDTSDIVYLTVTDPLSVSDFEEDIRLNVYPNPIVDYVTLEADVTLFGKTYKILDITGRVVFEGLIDRKINNVYLGHLPKATYTLAIENLKTTKHYKLVKI